MSFRLTITTDSAAFVEDPYTEILRILRAVETGVAQWVADGPHAERLGTVLGPDGTRKSFWFYSTEETL